MVKSRSLNGLLHDSNLTSTIGTKNASKLDNFFVDYLCPSLMLKPIEKDSYAKRRNFGPFLQPETGNGTAETAWLAYTIRKSPNNS